MTKKLIGIGELIIEGAHILRKNYKILLPISGIYAVYLFLMPFFYLHFPWEVERGARTLILHGIRIFIYLLIFISIIYSLKEKDPNGAIGRSLRNGTLLFLSFLIAYATLRLFMLLGLVFFIVPAVIFFVRYSLFPYVMVFEGENAMKALKRSKELVSGYWMGVFLRYLVLIFGAVILRNILNEITRGLPNIGLHIVSFIYYPEIIFFEAWRNFFAFPYISVGAPLADFVFIPYLIIFIYLIYLDLTRIKKSKEESGTEAVV